jgi:signal transduction histidine kinase
MTGQIPLEAELIERTSWLVRLRWLVVLGLSGSLALGWLWYREQLPLLPLLLVSLGIGLYNVQIAFLTRALRLSRVGVERLQQATRLVQVQIGLDLLALTALVHFTGGVESPATVLFLLLPVIVGILLPGRVSWLVAVLAVLMLIAIFGLEYVGVLAHYHPPILEGVELYRTVPYLLTVAGMMALSLGLAAYLTNSIRGRLQKREYSVVRDLESALDGLRELETVNKRLRRIDAERTRFLTLVTHELRAPINTIHTCVELALAGYASPEKVQEILERVIQRTVELSDLIGDLLRLARAREEEIRDEGVGLIQPEEVLRSVVQLMKAEADSKDLFLSVEIGDELAPVRAHPERLKLVWTNLLSNAIKYTEPGGIVSVTLKQTPEHLEGTVRDTGIGVPPEEQERVFEEFYRADNARAVSPVGTGVGLAIVRRIVENWGGKVLLDSEVGLGSKFTVVLPRADVAPDVQGTSREL